MFSNTQLIQSIDQLLTYKITNHEDLFSNDIHTLDTYLDQILQTLHP